MAFACLTAAAAAAATDMRAEGSRRREEDEGVDVLRADCSLHCQTLKSRLSKRVLRHL